MAKSGSFLKEICQHKEQNEFSLYFEGLKIGSKTFQFSSEYNSLSTLVSSKITDSSFNLELDVLNEKREGSILKLMLQSGICSSEFKTIHLISICPDLTAARMN